MIYGLNFTLDLSVEVEMQKNLYEFMAKRSYDGQVDKMTKNLPFFIIDVLKGCILKLLNINQQKNMSAISKLFIEKVKLDKLPSL